MGNVFRVLRRDVLRLLKTPPALVVIIALMVLPSVYTWYNVVGFWNPYENTGNLRVAVVNEDAGGSSELTGEMDLGDRIVEELHDNDQLKWVFTDHDDAMARLDRGDCYAAYVIPSDFTERLLGLTEGRYEDPTLRYYVNERLGPVSPKITDTGATTLDATINSTFVSTVSDVAVKTITEKVGEAHDSFDDARSSALLKVDAVQGGLDGARCTIGEVQNAAGAMRGTAADARCSLDAAWRQVQQAQGSLDGLAVQAQTASQAMGEFALRAERSMEVALDDAGAAVALARQEVQHVEDSLDDYRPKLQDALDQLDERIEDTEGQIAELQAQADALPDGSQKDQMLLQIEELKKLDEELQRQRTSVQGALDSLDAARNAAGALDTIITTSLGNVRLLSDTMFGATVPALGGGLGQMGASVAQISAVLGAQHGFIESAQGLLDDLDGALSTLEEAMGEADGLLASIQSDLGSVRDDLVLLGESDVIAELFGEEGLDARRIASFMGAPTHVVTERLYPMNAYGSAMAPLFMNLTFWIGAFMLLVIMKQEVDSAGIRDLTITQRYVGRFLLLAIIAAIQAIVCCAGVLFLGVEAASVAGLFFAAVVASLSYLSIIYALSVTLQHIGKGICVLLVFAQIPGATGLYPIEMTSSFFQAVYPLLPFTYGIGAMREAIGGFYGDQYGFDVGILLLFFALFMALGILVRPLMANVNRMVARQVRKSGMFNNEDVEVPARPYRLSQIVRVLTDKQEYREGLQQRYERFDRMYPHLIRGAAIVGVGVPVAVMVVFSLTPAEKASLLTFGLVWLVLLCIFLVVVESLRYSFERQLRLDTMSDEKLRSLYANRNTMERSGATEGSIAGAPAIASAVPAGRNAAVRARHGRVGRTRGSGARRGAVRRQGRGRHRR